MKAPISNAPLKELPEAVERFSAWPREDDRFVVFRGQANWTWDISPTIARPKSALRQYESEIIREIISVHPDDFLSDQTMFDRLVRMQHYGVPTRLIDVSVNPLVALYFATGDAGDDSSADGKVVIFDGPVSRRKYFDSDTVSGIANLANLTHSERRAIQASSAKRAVDFNKTNAVDRLLQFIRAEKPHFRPKLNKLDLTRPCYVIPKMSNRRLIAQAGSFIIQGLDRDSAEYERDINTFHLRIPNEKKGPLRASLERLGISGHTLFPEIEHTARQMVRRFESYL